MTATVRLTGDTLSALALAIFTPPAHADVDTDFASYAHTHGVYGQRDDNAWLGKITCKRLAVHLDANALESAAQPS